jgi:hypothetical protein
MVALAAHSSGRSTEISSQTKITTVMLSVFHFLSVRPLDARVFPFKMISFELIRVAHRQFIRQSNPPNAA